MKTFISPTVRLFLLLLAIGAAGVSAYLTWVIGFKVTPAGCGTGAGCSEVLASHWSKVLSVPVSLLGLLVHLTAIGCLFRFPSQHQDRSWIPRILMSTCLAALAAAAWFVLIQGIILKHVCLWCMTAHALAGVYALAYVGLAFTHSSPDRVAVNGHWMTPKQFGAAGLFGTLAVLVIVAIQVSQSLTFDLEKTEFSGEKIESNIRDSRSQEQRGQVVSLFDDQVEIFFEELPFLGNQESAPDVLFIYDYCCPFCRTRHQELKQRIKLTPDNRVVLMPIPTSSQCNEYWEERWNQHPGSCQLTKLALAVWRIDREKFFELDQWLCRGGTRDPIEATRYAEELVGAENLENSLGAPWIAETIKIISQTKHESGTNTLPAVLKLSDKKF